MLITVVFCMPRSACAVYQIMTRDAVAFSTSGIIPGASISANLNISTDGIHVKKGAGWNDNLWVESQKIPVDHGWHPSTVNLDLTLDGWFEYSRLFPLRCFFRYSADGDHWTSWQTFHEEINKDEVKRLMTLKFVAEAAVPQTQHERFAEYRREWKQSHDGDSEKAVANWILEKKDAQFLDHQIPFIAYMQIRIEGNGNPRPNAGDPTILRGAQLDMAWGYSGFRKLFR